MQNSFYRIESIRNPYCIISFRINWRKMPYILDKFHDMDIDIRKAHLRTNSATLYIKKINGSGIYSHEIDQFMNKFILNDYYNDIYDRHKTNQIVLPISTNVQIYNIPNLSKTTLEFCCNDRIGLLSDMIDLLIQFPYEIQNGYISTVGPYAHNMFFLQKNKKPLDQEDIQYISNVFEHEVKNREVFIQNNSPSQ